MDNRVRKVLTLITLGASLHAVQDCYSHSDWIHNRFDETDVKMVSLAGGGFRAPTWFEFRLAFVVEPSHIRTRTCASTLCILDRSRMQQFCTYGSVRGAISNGRPYRDNKASTMPWLSSFIRHDMIGAERSYADAVENSITILPQSGQLL